jgi:uncharacterized membrane protein (UPF0127 family)
LACKNNGNDTKGEIQSAATKEAQDRGKDRQNQLTAWHAGLFLPLDILFHFGIKQKKKTTKQS